MNENGLIGKSGTFYPCQFTEHIQTRLNNAHDTPFINIRTHCGDSYAFFEAFYTYDHTKPTKQQIDTLYKWCTIHKITYEEVTAVHEEAFDIR